jgi:hypothetical protein
MQIHDGELPRARQLAHTGKGPSAFWPCAAQFPRWGKDKLAVLLRREQRPLSVSMVGRILTQLKQQDRLIEPPRTGVAGRRRALRSRPYAIRQPEQYAVSRPGDLVEVDTLDVRPLPGVVFKQLTAQEVISHWDVLQAHTNVSTTATYYIKTVPAQVTDAMEKLEQALPESLSGNEVATQAMNATASSAVN